MLKPAPWLSKRSDEEPLPHEAEMRGDIDLDAEFVELLGDEVHLILVASAGQRFSVGGPRPSFRPCRGGLALLSSRRRRHRGAVRGWDPAACPATDGRASSDRRGTAIRRRAAGRRPLWRVWRTNCSSCSAGNGLPAARVRSAMASTAVRSQLAERRRRRPSLSRIAGSADGPLRTTSSRRGRLPRCPALLTDGLEPGQHPTVVSPCAATGMSRSRDRTGSPTIRLVGLQQGLSVPNSPFDFRNHMPNRP